MKIIYDEKEISLSELLRFYFMVIDPVSVNRQGNDRGIQYRTGIYYTDEGQVQEIRPVYDAEQEKAGKPLAVELEMVRNFFPAEEYHQNLPGRNQSKGSFHTGYEMAADRRFRTSLFY